MKNRQHLFRHFLILFLFTLVLASCGVQSKNTGTSAANRLSPSGQQRHLPVNAHR